MNKNKKVVLMDGHSILNRAFYGVPDLTNSEGMHTNAVYGFLNIMFKILEEEQPTHLAVAFDLKVPTFRHEMYAEYKGTRKAMPDELREQVPVMKEVLQAMDICTMELPGFEADDILGTMGKRFEKEGFQVCIVSGDRDLLQLATEHIQIRIPKTKKGGTEVENYYWQDVVSAYQVTPIEFIDLKALMGDTADNIPGVPSVGIKTATTLITTYHSIENLYDHLEEISRAKLKENLENGRELAFLSKTLATICTDAPVPVAISDTEKKNIFTSKAYTYMQRLEFKKILSRFQQPEEAAPEQQTCNYHRIRDLGEAQDVFRRAEACSTLGLSLLMDFDNNENSSKLYGMTLSMQDTGSSDINTYVIECQWLILPQMLLDEYQKLMKNAAIRVGVFDLKKQLKLVADLSQDFINVFDLEIAAYLLNPNGTGYGYDVVSSQYLQRSLPSKEDLLQKKTVSFAVANDLEAVYQMTAYEAVTALLAMTPLEQALADTNQKALFIDMEMPLVYALARMEQAGIMVRQEALASYSDELTKQIHVLEEGIYQEIGEEFNLNSPKQLGNILVEKLGVKGLKKTKTGYSTSAEVLEKLVSEHPVIEKILEYRQLTKLKSTYAEGLQNFICGDHRIHGTFNQTITATGRISSTEPNLQNIPIRMEIGRELRKVFVPKEGCILMDADYSQIELRILAHISGDENLIEAYRTESDIHRMTAAKVFQTPFDEVTEIQRRNAKAVNFGIVYGISAFGLSQDLGISKKQAETYISQYFATYPKIKEFLDGTVKEAKEQGYVTTLSGRRREIPELASKNFNVKSFGERIAMNSPIQGTAADIIKLAMIHTDAALRAQKLQSRIVLQIHDELLLEVPENEIEIVKALLVENMTNAMELAVPLKVEVGMGSNWLDAH